jgi:hypothetical protein
MTRAYSHAMENLLSRLVSWCTAFRHKILKDALVTQTGLQFTFDACSMSFTETWPASLGLHRWGDHLRPVESPPPKGAIRPELLTP